MNDRRIIQGLDWLDKEIQRDLNDIKSEKDKTIQQIKQLDKSIMFEVKPKKRKSIFQKLRLVFGYGKKR